MNKIISLLTLLSLFVFVSCTAKQREVNEAKDADIPKVESNETEKTNGSNPNDNSNSNDPSQLGGLFEGTKEEKPVKEEEKEDRTQDNQSNTNKDDNKDQSVKDSEKDNSATKPDTPTIIEDSNNNDQTEDQNNQGDQGANQPDQQDKDSANNDKTDIKTKNIGNENLSPIRYETQIDLKGQKLEAATQEEFIEKTTNLDKKAALKIGTRFITLSEKTNGETGCIIRERKSTVVTKIEDGFVYELNHIESNDPISGNCTEESLMLQTPNQLSTYIKKINIDEMIKYSMVKNVLPETKEGQWKINKIIQENGLELFSIYSKISNTELWTLSDPTAPLGKEIIQSFLKKTDSQSSATYSVETISTFEDYIDINSLPLDLNTIEIVENNEIISTPSKDQDHNNDQDTPVQKPVEKEISGFLVEQIKELDGGHIIPHSNGKTFLAIPNTVYFSADLKIPNLENIIVKADFTNYQGLKSEVEASGGEIVNLSMEELKQCTLKMETIENSPVKEDLFANGLLNEDCTNESLSATNVNLGALNLGYAGSLLPNIEAQTLEKVISLKAYLNVCGVSNDGAEQCIDIDTNPANTLDIKR